MTLNEFLTNFKILIYRAPKCLYFSKTACLQKPRVFRLNSMRLGPSCGKQNADKNDVNEQKTHSTQREKK